MWPELLLNILISRSEKIIKINKNMECNTHLTYDQSQTCR